MFAHDLQTQLRGEDEFVTLKQATACVLEHGICDALHQAADAACYMRTNMNAIETQGTAPSVLHPRLLRLIQPVLVVRRQLRVLPLWLQLVSRRLARPLTMRALSKSTETNITVVIR